MTQTVTNASWAVRLSARDLARIGQLRLMPGIDVCEEDGSIWLRGRLLDPPQERLLQKLAHGDRFVILADGQLRAQASRIPRGRLPVGPWIPLADWIVPEIPAAALAGKFERRIPLRLVRSAKELEPGILVTTMQTWAAYASEAPQVRLDCWSFALASDGRVIIRGEPIPPLPGECFSLQNGISTPVGWTWSPISDPTVLRELLCLEENSVALFHHDGAWELVRELDFVRATHSAVRLAIRGRMHAE